jgi:hypothetical protein
MSTVQESRRYSIRIYTSVRRRFSQAFSTVGHRPLYCTTSVQLSLASTTTVNTSMRIMVFGFAMGSETLLRACVGHPHSQNRLALALDDLLMMCSVIPRIHRMLSTSRLYLTFAVRFEALIVRWAAKSHVAVLARLADRCDKPVHTQAAGVRSTVFLDKRAVVIAFISRCEASRRRSCLSRFRHRDSPTGTLRCLQHPQKSCLTVWRWNIVHARRRHTAATKTRNLRSDISGTADGSDSV